MKQPKKTRHKRKLPRWKIRVVSFATAITGIVITAIPFVVADAPKTGAGLAEHARAQIGQLYWFGTFGQAATLDLLNQKRQQYPNLMTLNKYNQAKRNHLGGNKRAYDCSGLITSYWMQSTPTAKPQYKSYYDQNAATLYSVCPTRNRGLSTMPRVLGTLVFEQRNGSMSHMGVYVGNGYVVEARGFNYGVVKTGLFAREWTHWGQLPSSWLSYSPGSSGFVNYRVGDKVRIKSNATHYYPGEKMKWWVPGGTYTIAQVRLANGELVLKNGQPCVLLAELHTWVLIDNLEP